MTDDLFKLGRVCLETRQPVEKVNLTLQAARLLQNGGCRVDCTAAPVTVAPGRPDKPLLVHHSRLPQRQLSRPEGHAALIHALAHIEFTAINLAWDAVLRFRDLPPGYYHDWSRIAAEEAEHFTLLNERLHSLGHDYGDFTAHDGLWEMASKTDGDVLLRMALVPRVLEARGLDVTPPMIERLRQQGDAGTVAVLERIYADEIGHVAAGTRWFRFVCRQRELDPFVTFRRLLSDYRLDSVKSPLNIMARTEAGFDDEELDMLRGMTGAGA